MELSSVSTGVPSFLKISKSSPLRLHLPEKLFPFFLFTAFLHSILSCQEFNFLPAVVSEREPLAGSTGSTFCTCPCCSLSITAPSFTLFIFVEHRELCPESFISIGYTVCVVYVQVRGCGSGLVVNMFASHPLGLIIVLHVLQRFRLEFSSPVQRQKCVVG